MKRSRRTATFDSTALLVEMLETRSLLSAGLFAQPLAEALPLAGSSSSSVGYTPAQIRHAFGIDSIHFGPTVGDGSGQTIAIITAYDNPNLVSSGSSNFASSDLHKFDAAFGIADPPSFIKVNQTGGTSYPPPALDWAQEADLDVEWTHAIAPKAKIVLIEATTPSMTNLVTIAGAYARSLGNVSVVNMSFGVSEDPAELSFDSAFTTPSGHTPITFVAGTGDSGPPGTYPAFSPNVLAVGGTTLSLSGSNYSSEVGASISGGGISKYEPKPSYQSSVSTSSSKRTIPDVAFDGDKNTGVSVFETFNGGSTPWFKVGGSSLATPIWSALIAIANQGRQLLSLGTFNGATQALPALYKLASSDFHDITSGNNGFSAGGGYDLVTGRGTPIANKLVPDLVGGGSISGTVFNDSNSNFVQNSGESGFSGWVVYNDANNNKILDSGEFSTTTNSSGVYTFNDLPPTNYKIRAILPSGYTQTTPSNGFGWTIALTKNQVLTARNFGARGSSAPATATVTGTVFNDANGDGKDSSEAGLSGWTVYADLNNDSIFESTEPHTTTDSSGNYKLSGLAIGAIIIRALPQKSWNQTYPTNHFGQHLTLAAGQTMSKILFGEKKIA